MGGSSSSSNSAAAVEAPNNLLSNTYLKITDLLGEGVIDSFVIQSGQYGADPLCSVFYDNVPVRNAVDGSYNFNVSGQGFGFNYAFGTSGQIPITGFEKIENIVPLSSNTIITNPPVGAGTPKNVTATFSTSMFPDADSIRVTIRLPALYTADNVGNINAFNVSYAVDISLNNGPLNMVDTVAFNNGKCTSPYLYSTTYVLPKTTPAASSYQWTVRVRKVSQDILSAKTQNTIFVNSISVISASTYNYPNSAIVSTLLAADQFGAIPSRAYLVNGMRIAVPSGYTPTQYTTGGTITAATYPNVWLGGYVSGVWSDNPAWIFNDILSNPRYGLGDYVQVPWIDKWSLYQISQYCDQQVDNGLGNGLTEPRFTCNVNLAQADDAYNVLLNLASVFRGMIYYANGAITATQTSDKTPVYAYTNANVVGGQFSYADSAKNTRSTVALVRWNDPTNLYRDNVEYIEDVQGIARYGYIPKEATAFACTSRGQAQRIGSWIIQTEKLLTETVSFQVGLEGLYIRPGDVFNVYDNFRNNRSQGGRVLGFNSTRNTLTLDRPVVIDPGLTWVLTALVPKFVYNASGDVTGSNDINLIRNSQVEAYQVLDGPTSGTTTLSVNAPFSAGLFIGAPWVLSVSGQAGGVQSGTVFQNAGLYQCLAVNEANTPGLFDVVGLQYNTGLNFFTENSYTVLNLPPNSGDFSPIDPPTGLQISRVTGILSNNAFYSYLALGWAGTPSTNFDHYDVSGQTFGGVWTDFAQPRTTGVNFVVGTATGQTNFKVGAVSKGGVYSAFTSGAYVIPPLNPFGAKTPLSGIFIYQDFDPTLTDSFGYFTGYVGSRPGVQWNISGDTKGDVPWSQFITGYTLRISGLAGGVGGAINLLPAGSISLAGSDNNQYLFPDRFLYTGLNILGGQVRAMHIAVEPVDEFGNRATGASFNINNPAPPVPIASGFVGFNGGLSYNITPKPDTDLSGVYLWMNASSSFVPKFTNADYVSTNLAGFAPNSFTDVYWTWFALTDYFGTGACPIYGPISGNANGVFQTFQYDITAQITGAFGLLSGNFTNFSGFVTGQDYMNLLQVQGLSGQVTGLPGLVNTALNVRVNSAIVSTSGSLSTQIDAVSARTELSGAINYAYAGTIQSALTTTGGALSSWITNLGASTTGQTASIQIGAQAFVTGSVNGLGGAAVATWGFKLDANGKVVSMRATSANIYGQPSDYGVIAFSGASLQSEGFVKGSNGWRITPTGDAEFNNIVARGTFTGAAGTIAQTAVDANGITVGLPGSYRSRLGSFAGGFTALNANNDTMISLSPLSNGAGNPDGGVLNLYKSGVGTTQIFLDAYGVAGTPRLAVGPTQQIDIRGDGSITAVGTITGNTVNSYNSNIYGNGIRYQGVGGGSNNIAFLWNGANVKVYVDGSVQGTIPNP